MAVGFCCLYFVFDGIQTYFACENIGKSINLCSDGVRRHMIERGLRGGRLIEVVRKETWKFVNISLLHLFALHFLQIFSVRRTKIAYIYVHEICFT